MELNHKYAGIIYNVLVHGKSIGITWDYMEAKHWMERSMAPGYAKQIRLQSSHRLSGR